MELVGCVLWFSRIRKVGPSRQFQTLLGKVAFIGEKAESMFERFNVYHVTTSWVNPINVMLTIQNVVFHYIVKTRLW